MKKTVTYKYMGTNGTIETPVYIEGAYSICLVQLSADQGKILTNGQERAFMIKVPKAEVDDWKEVDI